MINELSQEQQRSADRALWLNYRCASSALVGRPASPLSIWGFILFDESDALLLFCLCELRWCPPGFFCCCVVGLLRSIALLIALQNPTLPVFMVTQALWIFSLFSALIDVPIS